MKKLFFILFFIPFVSLAQSSKSSTYYDLDSVLTLNSVVTYPVVPLAGKVRLFVWNDGSHTTGIYRMYHDGTTKRVDSSGTSGSGTSKRTSPFAWYNWVVADSQRIFESDTTFTIDSITVDQSGASSVVLNFKRKHAGSFSDIRATNYTATTSLANISTLQNTALVGGDEVWATIRSISGTATYIFCQVFWH